MKRYPLVVTFYTGPPVYQKYAKRLEASCQKLGLQIEVCQQPDQGSWVANCAMKGPFLYQRMQDLDAPILWVDADAVFTEKPRDLYTTEAEFAVYARPPARPGQRWVRVVGRGKRGLPPGWPSHVGPRWFNSGTVYFDNTRAAKDVLYLWAQYCLERPDDWDQWHLQEAWVAVQPQTLWLPRSYCDIKGREKKPIIVHDLASCRQGRVSR